MLKSYKTKYGNRKILTLDSFNKLYEENFHRLVHRALFLLKEKQISEDVVQDVFVDLWEKRKTRRIGNYNGYLHNAVKYQVYRLNKKKLTQKLYTESDEDIIKYYVSLSQELLLDKESVNMTNEYVDIIGKLIDELPDKCKSVFCMYCFERLTYKEIAIKNKISTKTVDNHIYKARKRIKEYIEQNLFTK
ncbi:MAG: sigma-70 family RNA polymerase sigma factor [Cellulophaga sp.]